MTKEQIFQLLEESFNEEQGNYLDTSAMDHLSQQDAGDPKFMLKLLSEFKGFEDDILFYLEGNFFSKHIINKFIKLKNDKPDIAMIIEWPSERFKKMVLDNYK